MRSTLMGRLAASLCWTLTIALLFGYLLLYSLDTQALQRTPVDFVSDLIRWLGILAYATLGVLIVRRHPRHAVGWLFCAVGLGAAAERCAAMYAIYALLIRPQLIGGLAAAWLQNWLWTVWSVLLFAFLPLLFPTGQLPTPRWRPAAWLNVVGLALLVVGQWFHTGTLSNQPELTEFENPLGVAPFGTDLFAEVGGPFGVVAGVGYILALIGMLVAAASVVSRLRQAVGEERRQIKWIAYVGGLLAVLFVVQAFAYYIVKFTTSGDAFDFVFSIIYPLTLTALPVATGLAILRHRLYDIDILIRRTLVYGALSAGLGLAYWVAVVLLQQVLHPFVQGSELAVIGSTLAVAALFSPARRAIQNFVDRRFYRRKYHAQRTLESFSVRLRQEVDLDMLSIELVSIAREAMQPAYASLWLKPAARDGAR
jgi:hypothetical protein